jgi:hypothetical protein
MIVEDGGLANGNAKKKSVKVEVVLQVVLRQTHFVVLGIGSSECAAVVAG